MAIHDPNSPPLLLARTVVRGGAVRHAVTGSFSEASRGNQSEVVLVKDSHLELCSLSLDTDPPLLPLMYQPLFSSIASADVIHTTHSTKEAFSLDSLLLLSESGTITVAHFSQQKQKFLPSLRLQLVTPPNLTSHPCRLLTVHPNASAIAVIRGHSLLSVCPQPLSTPTSSNTKELLFWLHQSHLPPAIHPWAALSCCFLATSKEFKQWGQLHGVVARKSKGAATEEQGEQRIQEVGNVEADFLVAVLEQRQDSSDCQVRVIQFPASQLPPVALTIIPLPSAPLTSPPLLIAMPCLPLHFLVSHRLSLFLFHSHLTDALLSVPLPASASELASADSRVAASCESLLAAHKSCGSSMAVEGEVAGDWGEERVGRGQVESGEADEEGQETGQADMERGGEGGEEGEERLAGVGADGQNDVEMERVAERGGGGGGEEAVAEMAEMELMARQEAENGRGGGGGGGGAAEDGNGGIEDSGDGGDREEEDVVGGEAAGDETRVRVADADREGELRGGEERREEEEEEGEESGQEETRGGGEACSERRVADGVQSVMVKAWSWLAEGECDGDELPCLMIVTEESTLHAVHLHCAAAATIFEGDGEGKGGETRVEEGEKEGRDDVIQGNCDVIQRNDDVNRSQFLRMGERVKGMRSRKEGDDEMRGKVEQQTGEMVVDESCKAVERSEGNNEEGMRNVCFVHSPPLPSCTFHLSLSAPLAFNVPCLTLLSPQASLLLAVGCLGTSQVFKLKKQKHSSTLQLSLLSSLPAVCPLFDVCLLDSHHQQQQQQQQQQKQQQQQQQKQQQQHGVLVASGVGKEGSLSHIQLGAAVDVLLTTPPLYDGLTATWTLKLRADSVFHSLFVMSFVQQTRILSVGETFDDISDYVPFVTSSSTLCCGRIKDGLIVQVTPRLVSLCHLSLPLPLPRSTNSYSNSSTSNSVACTWSPPSAATGLPAPVINVAAVGEGILLLSLSRPSLLVMLGTQLMPDGNTSLVELKCCTYGSEISCLSIPQFDQDLRPPVPLSSSSPSLPGVTVTLTSPSLAPPSFPSVAVVGTRLPSVDLISLHPASALLCIASTHLGSQAGLIDSAVPEAALLTLFNQPFIIVGLRNGILLRLSCPFLHSAAAATITTTAAATITTTAAATITTTAAATITTTAAAAVPAAMPIVATWNQPAGRESAAESSRQGREAGGRTEAVEEWEAEGGEVECMYRDERRRKKGKRHKADRWGGADETESGEQSTCSLLDKVTEINLKRSSEGEGGGVGEVRRAVGGQDLKMRLEDDESTMSSEKAGGPMSLASLFHNLSRLISLLPSSASSPLQLPLFSCRRIGASPVSLISRDCQVTSQLIALTDRPWLLSSAASDCRMSTAPICCIPPSHAAFLCCGPSPNGIILAIDRTLQIVEIEKQRGMSVRRHGLGVTPHALGFHHESNSVVLLTVGEKRGEGGGETALLERESGGIAAAGRSTEGLNQMSVMAGGEVEQSRDESGLDGGSSRQVGISREQSTIKDGKESQSKSAACSADCSRMQSEVLIMEPLAGGRRAKLSLPPPEAALCFHSWRPKAAAWMGETRSAMEQHRTRSSQELIAVGTGHLSLLLSNHVSSSSSLSSAAAATIATSTATSKTQNRGRLLILSLDQSQPKTSPQPIPPWDSKAADSNHPFAFSAATAVRSVMPEADRAAWCSDMVDREGVREGGRCMRVEEGSVAEEASEEESWRRREMSNNSSSSGEIVDLMQPLHLRGSDEIEGVQARGRQQRGEEGMNQSSNHAAEEAISGGGDKSAALGVAGTASRGFTLAAESGDGRFNSSEFELGIRHSILLPGPVSCISSFLNNFLLAAVVNTLFCLGLSSKPPLCIRARARVRSRHPIAAMSCRKDRIIVADARDGILVYTLNIHSKHDIRFELLFCDASKRSALHCLPLSAASVAAVDVRGSLALLAARYDSQGHHPERNLQLQNSFNLGEMPRRLLKGSLAYCPPLSSVPLELQQWQDSWLSPSEGHLLHLPSHFPTSHAGLHSSSILNLPPITSDHQRPFPPPSLLASTFSGSIVVFLPISRRDYEILSLVEKELARHASTAPLMGNSLSSFRKAGSMDGPQNVLDGDMLWQFLDLSSSEREDIMRSIPIMLSVDTVVQALDSMQAIIC